MIKNTCKRFLSFLLAFVLVLSALPLQAWAVAMLDTTVLDGKIAVTSDGVKNQGSGVVNNDGTITVTTKATANCKVTSYSYTANAHTVLVKNTTTDETLMVEFAYEASGLGALTIDGVAKTSTPTGTYSKSLAPGESITIVITSPASGSSGTGATATIVLRDFELKDTGAKNVTVMKMDGGTTVVNGTTLSAASTTVATDYATGVTVKATAASGYTFLGWVDGDMNVLSTLLEDTVHPLADMTVAAAFVPSDGTGYWLADSRLFTDFDQAADAADAAAEDKTMTLLTSTTLGSGTYEVPEGVTLLIPKDRARTAYGDDPALADNGAKWVTPTPYVTLTLASGANLVVNGTMELAAMHYIATGSGSNSANLFGGAINGAYGHVATESGATLTVNGTLYAWGIVSGSGEVIANSGSSVYEKMQITDYRGGGATSAVVSQTRKKAFPFNQYYVQNIEATEIIYYGATVYIHAGVYASGPESSSVVFVGTGTSAMFGLEPGSYIVKDYIEWSDRLSVDLYGSGSLNPIGLTFSGQTVNSSSFRLGINNNIDIGVHGGVVKITQEIVLQPGATVSVDRNATLYVPEGINVFVLDQEDWGNFARSSLIIPVYWSYANGRNYVRSASTVNDLSDAMVDVNGTVVVGGSVYTSGGQSIISSGKTGVYALLTSSPTDTNVYQVTGTDTLSIYGSSAWTEIAVTAADLVNGDASVTGTASGAQYDAFIYDSFQDKWIQQNIYNDGAGYTAKLTYNANDGTETPATTEQTMDFFGQAAAFMGSGYTAMAPYSMRVLQNANEDGEPLFVRDGFKFAGWNTVAEPTEENPGVAVEPDDYVTISAHTTLYAIWEGASFELIIDEEGKEVKAGEDLSEDLPKDLKFYEFFKDEEKTEDVTLTEKKMPAHDLYVFSKPTYNLYLDGTKVTDDDLLADESIKDRLQKELTDVRFYSDEACTQVVEITEDKMPEHDLYAKTLYTLTFRDEDGEAIANAGGKFVEGEKITAPTYTPKQENHVFTAWVEDAEGSPAFDFTNAVMPARNLTVDAQVMQYWTVEFKLDNEVVYDEQANKENDFSVTINYADPTKDGYIFKGWYDGSNYYKNGDTISEISNNMVLTAEFEVDCDHSNTKPVSNGDGTHDIVCTNVLCNNYVVENDVECSGGDADCTNLAVCSICKAKYGQLDEDAHDYQFTKYDNITADKHTAVYTCHNNGAHINNVTEDHDYGDDGVCDCTATKTYTISFDTDGDGDVDVTRSAVAHGTAPEAPAASKTETAEFTFTFSHWEDADGNKYTTLPKASADVTYTAKFTNSTRSYTISWDTDGNGTVDDTTTVLYGKVPTHADGFFAATAEYTYTFTGWKDSAGKAPAAVTGEATYTAQFTKSANTYKVIYKVNGVQVHEASVAYGETIPSYTYSAPVGYTFNGWDVVIPTTMPANDVIVTGTTTINSYTITWNDDEGKLIDTTTVKHGETPTYADPSKAETAQYTYTFAGWTPDVVAATGEATYSATFTPVLRKYNITFKVDGEEDKVVEVNYGEIPSYGSTPTKDSDTQYSYTFAGWKNSAGDVVDTLPDVTGPATYTATWTKTPVVYSVTFKIGEEIYFLAEGGYGTEIDYSKFAEPSKTGYSFDGWSQSKPETFPAENLVITGSYTVNKYKITFKNYNEWWPEFKFDDIVIEKDFNAEITEADLSAVNALNDRIGYNVTWYVLSSGTGSPFFGEGAYKYTVPDNMPAHDIEVYSYWSPESYPFTIRSSIDNSLLKDSGYIDYNATIGSPENLNVWSFYIADHTPKGYTFAGYLLNNEPLEYPYIHDKTEALELVAKFEPIEYTITFMNGNEVYHEITAGYRTAVTLPKAPTMEGFTFTGWVDAEGNAANLSTMPLDGMTVYAAFSVDSFKVNFFATEGDTTALQSFDVPFGTKLTATVDDPATEEDETDAGKLAELLDLVADPSKEGNTWNGWNISSVPETMPAEAVDIYGTWTVNKYYMYFENPLNPDADFRVEMMYQETYPTKENFLSANFNVEEELNVEGYTFTGFKYDDGTDVTFPFVHPAHDTTIIAQYEVNEYTITFDTVGGEPATINAITADYGDAISWPENPTKLGHTFKGWDKDNDGVADILPDDGYSTMPAGNLELKAVWQRNTIYITWIIDGVEDIDEYQYGDKINAPAATKATDSKWSYRHTGWDKDVPETATVNATYTAQFAEDQAVEYKVKFINGENALYETEVAWNGEVTLDGFEAPTETGKTLSWTVEGADVSFPYAMTTADVTFVAKWTPNTYTITADGVEHPFPFGAAVSIEAPTKEGHTFKGWLKDGAAYELPENMPAEDIVITSDWSVNTYTLTVSSRDAEGKGVVKTETVPYDADLSGYYLETPSYKDDDGTLYEFDNWSVWTWQNNDDNTMAEYTGTTMPASNVKMYATYTFTGWYELVTGFTSYAVKSDIAHYRDEWATIDDAQYYFVFVDDEMYSYIVKDITLIDGSYYAFDHDTGAFLSDLNGIYTANNGDLYYVENGIAVANKGLVKNVNADGHIHYYYFGCGMSICDSAECTGEYLAQKANSHWAEITNGYLVQWGYTFDENGVVLHQDDTSLNGIQIIDGVKYYLIDGVKVHYGLFIGDDDAYYYARSSGALVVDQTYWISGSHLNGVEHDGEPVEEGYYTFDAEGRIVWPSTDKNGIYAEDGGLYYYENGVRTYAGLIEIDGDYYYVRGTGQLAVGRYWVTKNNGVKPSGNYMFDDEGKMVLTNGFVEEDGGIYYYLNGNRYHAGLIKYNGDFYYVKSNGQAVTSTKYWITHVNGYDKTDGIEEGSYEFTAEGKMIIPEPVVMKNGVYEEDGKLMYYVDGKLNYAGLTQYTGALTKEDGTVVEDVYQNAYIYVRGTGELVVGRSYWTTKTNDVMKARSYTFDANGIMLNPSV